MNPLFKWVLGQKNTGYWILTLAWVTGKWLPIPFDLYILKYPTGAYNPPHRDPIKRGQHYRLNIILTKPLGGEFVCETPIFSSWRIHLFRPDICTHSVTPVERGTRYVLSLGWTWPSQYTKKIKIIKDYLSGVNIK
jgi:hypothetical protein